MSIPPVSRSGNQPEMPKGQGLTQSRLDKISNAGLSHLKFIAKSSNYRGTLKNHRFNPRKRSSDNVGAVFMKGTQRNKLIT